MSERVSETKQPDPTAVAPVLPAGDKPAVHGTAVLAAPHTTREATAVAKPGAVGRQTTLVGRVLDDRYEVMRKLGEGAMGVVYEVRHLRLDKRFAMKVIHGELAQLPEFIARFEREALACSRMDHPNTISVTDFGRAASGELFLVMEFVEGDSIQELVEHSPLPVSQALETTRQLLLALQHAHAAGVIHRDIKPENIMRVVTDDGTWRVKVLDFGIAMAPVGGKGGQLTQAGVIFGTPQYMAPEQAMSATVDARADLYAAGATLWRMLTGRPLFKGEGPVEILSAKLSQPPPDLDDVAPGVYSPAMVQLVRRALARRPLDRYASAEEMLEAVIQIQRAPGRGMAPPPRWGQLGSAGEHLLRLGRRTARMGIDWYHGSDRWSGRLRALVTTRQGGILSGLALVLLLLLVLFPLLQVASIPDTPSVAFTSRDRAPDPAIPTTPDGVREPSKPASTPTTPTQKRLIRVRLLLEKGACNEAAVDLLNLLRDQPRLAEGHYLLGVAEFCRRRYRSTLQAYARAIEIDTRYRRDVRVLAHLGQLMETRKIQEQAVSFVGVHLGREGLPLLVKQASQGRNSDARHSAITYAARLGGASQIDWVSSLSLDLAQLPTCEERCKVVARLGQLGNARALTALRKARDQTMRAGIFRRTWRNGCCRTRIVDTIKKLMRKPSRRAGEPRY